LEENFDRHVLWTLKKYPELARYKQHLVGKGKIDTDRVQKTFDANLVSLKLICFHVHFFRHIACPGNHVTPDEIADNYDRFYGRPSDEMKVNLQKKIFEIQKMQNWEEFFRLIHEKVPPRDVLSEWLVKSLLNSAKKGYHKKFNGHF